MKSATETVGALLFPASWADLSATPPLCSPAWLFVPGFHNEEKNAEDLHEIHD